MARQDNRLVIGCDPGVTGAVALIALKGSGISLLDVVDIPTSQHKVNGSMKNHLMLPALADVFRRFSESMNPFSWDVDVFIEQVGAMPGQGVTSMFRFGFASGALEGVAAGIGLRVHRVSPREWQPLARVQKDPDAGRLRANQLFPDQASKFARKMDHNRADAALIGFAGAMMLLRDASPNL